MDVSVYARLDDIKTQASGNSQKIAEYVAYKDSYSEFKTAHFNEEFPFSNVFDEGHLNSLKEFAADNPDDESAQYRYALQKERYSVQEAKRSLHIDLKFANRTLREKVEAGTVTKADLAQAAALAKRNGSDDNRVLYATIKSMINE
jgi:hypothetical protein